VSSWSFDQRQLLSTKENRFWSLCWQKIYVLGSHFILLLPIKNRKFPTIGWTSTVYRLTLKKSHFLCVGREIITNRKLLEKWKSSFVQRGERISFMWVCGVLATMFGNLIRLFKRCWYVGFCAVKRLDLTESINSGINPSDDEMFSFFERDCEWWNDVLGGFRWQEDKSEANEWRHRNWNSIGVWVCVVRRTSVVFTSRDLSFLVFCGSRSQRTKRTRSKHNTTTNARLLPPIAAPRMPWHTIFDKSCVAAANVFRHSMFIFHNLRDWGVKKSCIVFVGLFGSN